VLIAIHRLGHERSHLAYSTDFPTVWESLDSYMWFPSHPVLKCISYNWAEIMVPKVDSFLEITMSENIDDKHFIA